MKVIIAIILIVIIIILSFNNIINEYFINSSQITCGTTDNNIDVTCNLYNTKKSLLIDIQSAYNLAKKTTEDKYDLWIFSKNNVSLKKAVLDQANIVDTHLKNKNAIELIINIIKSIIYAKAAVTIINYQYSQTSNEYKNAINTFNYYANNAQLLQINSDNGSYNTPSEALTASINAYNNNVASLTNKGNLILNITQETRINILENALINAKDLIKDINDKYLIPSLTEYNNLATAANIINYDINSDLTLLKPMTNSQYELAIANEQSNISSALANYKSAISNELDKLNIFYNIIVELKPIFLYYINFLINPENGYNNNTIPTGTGRCDTKANLSSLAATTSANQAIIDANKNIARNNSTQHPTNNIVYMNTMEIEQKYNNLIQSMRAKINMLSAINENNENNYSKDDLMNVSKNMYDKYSDFINSNDALITSVNDYNKTTEKQNYNDLSMQSINNSIINLNAIADIKRCYPNSDRPTIGRAT
jgi:hypothetical protein